MTDQTATAPFEGKVNIEYADLGSLTDKQVLWNIYARLKSIQLLLAILVAVTLLAVLGSVFTVMAINHAGGGGL